MQGQQQGRVGEALQHLQEAATDVLKSLAPVFAPVHRGQNHPLPFPVQAGQGEGRCRGGGMQQGVNDRVAGDQHLAHHPGGLQVGCRHGGGGEMEQGHLGDQPPVGFLREGIEEVVGAQPGLHMAHRDLGVEGRQGRGKGRGGVPLHDHQVGGEVRELLAQPLQGRAGHVGEGLLGGHQGQVPVGLEGKQLHHLVDHLPVLAREHQAGVEALGRLEGLDHRGQLDRLRAGAKHDADLVGGFQGSDASGLILKRPTAIPPKKRDAVKF